MPELRANPGPWGRSRTSTLAALLGLAATTTIAALTVAWPAGAEPDARSAATATLLGDRSPPRASCPSRPCEAVGRVTGFQVDVNGRRGLYQADADGRIVAWSVSLSRPRPSQIRFFNDFFGSPPRARLAVLRERRSRRSRRRHRYRLVEQSPLETLTRFYGQAPIFTLTRSLAIKEDDFIALTVPTWVPAFAVGQSRGTAWRASRRRGRCTGENNIKRRSAQQAPRSIRRYGCRYNTAQLLYSAYMVRNRRR